jgi:hypothetical protein
LLFGTVCDWSPGSSLVSATTVLSPCADHTAAVFVAAFAWRELLVRRDCLLEL